jgi:hypothetical protein
LTQTEIRTDVATDAVTTADADAPPDWGATTEPVCCPLCDYDLRGLAQSRCPECGYRFTWPEVLDPNRRAHPYLFEHHPYRSPWAFFRTLFGGLRPTHFWTSLLPSQPGRPRRLVAYWLLAAMPLCLAYVGSSAQRAWLYARERRQERAVTQGFAASNPAFAAQMVSQFGSVDAYLDEYYALPPSPTFFRNLFRWHYWGDPRPFDKLALALFTWPWLTALALMVFRISMRRARIRPVHVLRCVLYSADAVLGAGLVTLLFLALQAYNAQPMVRGRFPDVLAPPPFFLSHPRDNATAAMYFGCVAAVLFLAYRLTAAYRHYLRFDRPVATVLASQVIVLLVVWILMVNWGLPY